MGEVGEALARYASVVDEAGFDYFGQMNRGRDRRAVISALLKSGLRPHEDVIDWYCFHDGVRPQSDDPSVELYGFAGVCALEDALTHRAVRLSGYLTSLGLSDDDVAELDRGGLVMPYESEWMPITVGQETCVVDTSAIGHPPRLLALWDDEQQPREKASSLSEWVRQLTDVALEGGLSWRSPVDSVTIARIAFDHGSLDYTELGYSGSATLVRDLTVDYRSPKVVVQHCPVGSVTDNESLERRQAEEVALYLRETLNIELPIEFRAAEVPAGHKVLVEIRAGLPEA